MSFTSLMPSTMRVTRPAKITGNAVLAPKRTFSNVSGYTAVPCRVTELSGDERTIAGREGTIVTHRVSYPPEYTLKAKDRVVISSTTYDVEEPPQPKWGATEVHHYTVRVTVRA